MQEPATTPTTVPSAAEQPTPAPRSTRAARFIVFLVVFIDLLGFALVPPLRPLFGFASRFVDVPAAPGAAAAILSLGALLLAWARLPETLRAGAPPVGRRGWLNIARLVEVLRMPSVGVLVATFFLATFAFGSLESTLALANKLLLTGSVEETRTITREALRTTERSNFLV